MPSKPVSMHSMMMLFTALSLSSGCQRNHASSPLNLAQETALVRHAQSALDTAQISIKLDPGLLGTTSLLMSALLVAAKENRFSFQWSNPTGRLPETVSTERMDDYLGTTDLNIRHWFNALFGGERASDVLRYIDERVNYVFPIAMNAGRRGGSIVLLNFGVSMYDAWAADAGPSPQLVSGDARLSQTPSPRVGLIAVDPGAMEHSHARLARRLQTLGFTVDAADRAILSSVEWFTDTAHEARHSDCSAPLQRVDALLSVHDHNEYRSSAGRRCTFVHDYCERGSAVLRRQPVCDSEPWGPFSVEMILTGAIAKYGSADLCNIPGVSNPQRLEHCRELTKQAALVLSGNAFARLNTPVIEAQFNPSDRPPVEPDMSSFAFDASGFQRELDAFHRSRFGAVLRSPDPDHLAPITVERR